MSYELRDAARAKLPERTTGQDLAELFSHENCSQNLRNMNNYTRQERKEGSFVVFRSLGKDKYRIAGVDIQISGKKAKITERDFIRGKSHSAKSGLHISSNKEGKIEYPLIGVHTHTGRTVSSYRPSAPDLYALADARNFLRSRLALDIRPVEVISIPFDAHLSSLLMFQENTANPLDVQECIDSSKYVRKRMKNSSIFTYASTLLEETGHYNAAYFVFDEKCGLELAKEQLERFSFEVNTYQASSTDVDSGTHLINQIRLEGPLTYLRNRLLP